jgi:hypothetical protein
MRRALLWFTIGVLSGLTASTLILASERREVAALQAEVREIQVRTQRSLAYAERIEKEAAENDRISAEARWQNERERVALRRERGKR